MEYVCTNDWLTVARESAVDHNDPCRNKTNS